MRAWMALVALGVVVLVVSIAWLAAEVVQLLTAPPVPRRHFTSVLEGFLASMTLLALSLALLLEGRAARRRAQQGRASRKRPDRDG